VNRVQKNERLTKNIREAWFVLLGLIRADYIMIKVRKRIKKEIQLYFVSKGEAKVAHASVWKNECQKPKT